MAGNRTTVNAGGAATQAGIDYQNRVAAWLAVCILADEAAARPWDLPSDPVFLQCETQEPVDDLLLSLSGGGFVFVQAKHRLKAEKDPASDFGQTIRQFVRQYLACASNREPTRPWRRPLAPDEDRLVCISGPGTSTRIQKHLCRVLERFRASLPNLDVQHVPRGKEEEESLGVFLQHVRRGWEEQTGQSPSAPSLREFLSLVRFELLDVDSGGLAEREAKGTLRTAVLQEPAASETCWALLIETCAQLAKNHSGANRKAFFHILADSQIKSKAPASYMADIKGLLRYSSRTAKAVRDLSVISFRRTQVKIQRQCSRALYDAVKDASILVIGDPGAGKSGALHDLVETLEAEKRDCVFLAVDRLDATSLPSIKSALGLTHDLVDVLSNWPGNGSGLVVIDALDAARDEAAAKAVRDLVAEILQGDIRWHVVASVRKFDLRYNEELKRLFFRDQMNPLVPAFADREFQAVSHVKIPLLVDQEISQVSMQSPELGKVIGSVSSDLRDLLRIPFNIRLLAQLVQEGVTSDELRPIRTQLQLLDKYWNYRVLQPPLQASAQEALLGRACEKMIEARTLQVEHGFVADTTGGAALDRLLSNHVLTEWQSDTSAVPDRSLLTFSHHVLFDYAVARLLLRGHTASLLGRLIANPDLAIVIRPSFLYHFRHLWALESDHRSFWEAAFQIASHEQISEIAKTIGPSVTPELARTGSDFDLLCSWLQGDHEQGAVGETLLDHAIGAAIVSPPSTSSAWTPWCNLLARIGANLRPRTAYSLNALLFVAFENLPFLLSPQKAALGIAARALLEFAWTQSPRDGWLVIQGIRSVCKTYEIDPSASGTLLRRALAPDHIAAYGYEELPWLARSVAELATLDPDLTEEVYRVAFLHEETSEEPTPIGPSRIFSLVSNRRQDFDMARYELAQKYAAFLKCAPKQATLAVLAAIEGYISRERSKDARLNGENERTFKFHNCTSRLRVDYSSIWDSQFQTQRDDALQIVSTFFQWLEEISADQKSNEVVARTIMLLAENNRTAIVWRRLLELGTRQPKTVGKKIVPLAEAVPVLTAYDTSEAVGKYLQAVYPLLTPDQGQRIEDIILSLPEKGTADGPKHAEKVRNQLLGCLPLEWVRDNRTRELIERLRITQSSPRDRPKIHIDGPFAPNLDEEDPPEKQEVPAQAEADQKIRNLAAPVAAFAAKHSNSTPPTDEALEIYPAMTQFREVLYSAAKEGVQEMQLNQGWGQLAEACERISRCPELSCLDQSGRFLVETLLKASNHSVPEPHPDEDEQFDESPSWGGPAARISAAQGLLNLSRIMDCATPELLAAVERLCADPVPSVRFQVAIRLDSLHDTNRELMWELFEKCSAIDPSRGVLSGLLDSLARLGGHYPDRASSLVGAILRRFENEPGTKLREHCLTILSSLYIWRNQPLAKQLTLEAVEHLIPNTAALSALAFQFREVLTYGQVQPADPGQDAVRRRGIDLLARIIVASISALRRIEAEQSNSGFKSWPEDERQKTKDLLHVVAHIAKEIYFASGAFDNQQQGSSRGAHHLTLPQKGRFYIEMQPLFDQLADLGMPAISHTLLETLESLIQFDPRGIFLSVNNTVRKARAGGYQFEQMAVELIVRIVERYLAEYRLIFQQDKDCRQALIEVLDVFVRAGWPAARRITYRLEEIFR